MTEKTPSSWYLLKQNIDFFRSEAERFHRDVHLLVLGTLEAARKAIQADLEQENSQIEAAMKKATGEYHEYLVDSQIELQTVCADQERFLRNMALVGLASLLNHTLRQMARHAESFSPRRKKYNDPALGRTPSDFEKLWIEFKDRFGFDLQAEHSLIGFIKPLNDVRNKIVHDGGLANPPKYWQDVGQIDLQPNTPIGTDTFLDLRFSQEYPEFVNGDGSLAEVTVCQEQLESMIENAGKLVDYCAERIRLRELLLVEADEQLRRGETQ
jgi:hypothetical protein